MVVLAATAQIISRCLQNNCNSIFTKLILLMRRARDPGQAFSHGIRSTLLETVNRKSTVCGPSYDFPGDEDLVQLKDYKRCEKKIISVNYYTYYRYYTIEFESFTALIFLWDG